jgi:phenylacetate-CoA ligase
VIPISSGNTKRQIKIMQDYKTTALVATPSYALHLVETMAEMGLNTNSLSLRRAHIGGEPWSEAIRKRIEAELHVSATDNYGIPEVLGPGIAGECLERGGLHVAEDHFLLEVVDPLTLEPVRHGDRGELVLTTLTKEAFPLVRYRTRELVSLLEGPCPCGRTSVRMSHISARTDDMLVVKGVNVFPSQVGAVLRDMLGTEPNYEIVVERHRALDETTVLVEVSESLFFDEMRRQTEFKERLRHRLASELGVSFEIKLAEKKTLERVEGKGPGNVRDLRKW